MKFIKTTTSGGLVFLMPATVRGVGRRDYGESGRSRYTASIDELDETCIALHSLRLTL
jgi:hypothetical protein